MIKGLFHKKTKANGTDEESKLFGSLSRFHDEDIRFVIVPRAEMKSLDIATSVKEASEFMASHRLSSVVVYRDRLDRVAGVLTAKSLLRALTNGRGNTIAPYLDSFIPVPSSMKRVDAFYTMLNHRASLAVVFDEHGGVDGCVTLRGLIDSLTQSLTLNPDADAIGRIEEQEDGTFVVDGRLPLEVAVGRCGLAVKEQEREDVDSVGGLAALMAGRIPARGEVIDYNDGWRFEVTKADRRRVHQVRLVPPQKN